MSHAAPRVFLVRHGATSWSDAGRYTSTTEVELTDKGTRKIATLARACVGPGKLIDPARLTLVFLSPRTRAQQTYMDLMSGIPAPKHERIIRITEDVAEWQYGDYEGLTTEQIVALRRARGLDAETPWSIWRDGCEGGESEAQITERLQLVIDRVKYKHSNHADQDVLIVAHGLINRCFIKLWVGLPVSFDLPMTLEPGSVTVLSYKNGDISKPCLLPGLALPVQDEDGAGEGDEQ